MEVIARHGAARPDLTWMLDDVVERVDGVREVVVLSTSGLLVTRSAGVQDRRAQRLSAVASAFHSLARGTAARFSGGDVQQMIVEMDDAVLLVTSAGYGACLAVLATPDTDLEAVGFELGMLERRVGPALSDGGA